MLLHKVYGCAGKNVPGKKGHSEKREGSDSWKLFSKKPGAHESYLLTAKFIHATCLTQKPPVCAQLWKGFWHEWTKPYQILRAHGRFLRKASCTNELCRKQIALVCAGLNHTTLVGCMFTSLLIISHLDRFSTFFCCSVMYQMLQKARTLVPTGEERSNWSCNHYHRLLNYSNTFHLYISLLY